MDSWSQTLPNTEDQVQQEHWREETDKLWSAATESDQTFEFQTIDDVLDENAKCKEENIYLHNVIDDNITELYEGLNVVSSRVDQNELDLTENKAAITVNADQITDLETERKKVIF